MSNKYICTTTIYPVDIGSLEQFDNMSGWTLIVAGDLKTPKDFKLKNGIYLSPEDQVKIDPILSDVIGWNCIQRRNFAFLMAGKMNCDIGASIDQDNLPLENWGKDIFVGNEVEGSEIKCSSEVFDPLGATINYSHLWHRGFPLELVSSRHTNQLRGFGKSKTKIDIQSNFWDGSPDIDAFQRITLNPECRFDPRDFPFWSDKISPFNSQNTIFTKEVLSKYFMFPFVSRMDDIWNSYYIQAKYGFKVGYFEPTVYQERNPQNLIKNLEGEYVGYSHVYNLIKDILIDPERIWKYMPERTKFAYDLYRKHFE